MMATGPLKVQGMGSAAPCLAPWVNEQKPSPNSLALLSNLSFRFPELNCSRVEFITTHSTRRTLLPTIIIDGTNFMTRDP